MMNKIFCIGLHKTGTTTLYKIAKQLGVPSVHGTRWQHSSDTIKKYTFFSDGGSHYDQHNVFDYKAWYMMYPESKFIINCRDVNNWIVSKLKHAKWNDTVEIASDLEVYSHKDWRHKSRKNIELFIDHYFNWYIEILNFFYDKQDRAVYVDIPKNITSGLNYVFGTDKYQIPHDNRSREKAVPEEIVCYANELISEHDMKNTLNKLIERYI